MKLYKGPLICPPVANAMKVLQTCTYKSANAGLRVKSLVETSVALNMQEPKYFEFTSENRTCQEVFNEFYYMGPWPHCQLGTKWTCQINIFKGFSRPINFLVHFHSKLFSLLLCFLMFFNNKRIFFVSKKLKMKFS